MFFFQTSGRMFDTDSFEENVETYLESNSEEDVSHSVSVLVDEEDKYGYMCVAMDGTTDYPTVAPFISNLVNELDIVMPHVEAEFDGENGLYEVAVTESKGELPQVYAPRELLDKIVEE